MKIAFLGSSAFSVEVLKEIVESSHEILAVICPLDKPSGRGNKMQSPLIKTYALSQGIKVYQFDKIKNHVDVLKTIGMDAMITASFGQILTPSVLAVCPVYNVHASLLPKYRGASPIQHAIMNGDKVTGITIMRTDAGIDTGDMIMQEEVYIDDLDDTLSLSYKLSRVGGRLIVKFLDELSKGKVEFNKQPDNEATYAGMIKSEEGKLDFSKPAKEIVNKIRALSQEPGCYFFADSQKLKVFKAEIVHLEERTVPGMIITTKDKLIIACNGDAVSILELQAPGGKVLKTKDFLNGRKIISEMVDGI